MPSRSTPAGWIAIIQFQGLEQIRPHGFLLIQPYQGAERFEILRIGFQRSLVRCDRLEGVVEILLEHLRQSEAQRVPLLFAGREFELTRVDPRQVAEGTTFLVETRQRRQRRIVVGVKREPDWRQVAIACSGAPSIRSYWSAMR